MAKAPAGKKPFPPKTTAPAAKGVPPQFAKKGAAPAVAPGAPAFKKGGKVGRGC